MSFFEMYIEILRSLQSAIYKREQPQILKRKTNIVEVESAARSLKLRKAPGWDQIQNELYD